MQIELTGDGINLILTALSELPFKAVHSLIPNIKGQTEAQLGGN